MPSNTSCSLRVGSLVALAWIALSPVAGQQQNTGVAASGTSIAFQNTTDGLAASGLTIAFQNASDQAVSSGVSIAFQTAYDGFATGGTAIAFQNTTDMTGRGVTISFGAPLPTNSRLTWFQQFPLGAPPGLAGLAMAYDSNRGETVLFGGQSASYQNSTWIWDGASWTLRSPATSPPARGYSCMAFDSVRKQVVLFGGQNASGALSDTWVWDGVTWTQKSPTTGPPRRSSASNCMAFDSGHAQVVMLGGVDGSTGRNDTWTWDGANWSQKSSPAVPSPGSTSLAFDSLRGVVVAFASGTSTALVNETWEWDGSRWNRYYPWSSPSPRAGQMMAFDPGSGTAWLFGGQAATATYLNDLWTWNGSDWTPQTPAASPSARASGGMAFDSAHSQFVLFGGMSGATTLNDTWLASTGAAPTGTISVSTNLAAAAFTITGPAAYTGAGTSFTQANAPAGSYTVSYGAVGGYSAPPDQTIVLAGGGTIAFTGTYQGGSGTAFLYSDFNNGLIQGWQTFVSGWTVTNGVVQATNTTANARTEAVWSAGFGWADYTASAAVMLQGTQAPSDGDLLFRYQDQTHYGACRLRQNATGANLELYDAANGVIRSTPFAAQQNTWYTVRASIAGSAATCEVMEYPATLISGSYSSTASGTVGLRNSDIVVSFDNVVVVGGGPLTTPAAVDGVTLLALLPQSGSTANPGDSFTKTVRLQNSGTTTWIGYKLAFVSSAASTNMLSSGAANIIVSTTAPGAYLDIPLTLRAPSTGGSYSSLWQMQNASGSAFGGAIEIDVTVQTGGASYSLSGTATYDTATSILSLNAAVKDGTGQTVNTGTLPWILRNSSGAQTATGSLTYQSGQWQYSATVPGLAPGQYKVTYTFTLSGKTAALALNLFVEGQYQISGRVKDSGTHLPISGAQVAAGGKTATSGSDGSYSLSGVPSSAVTISASHTNYASYSASISMPSGSKSLVRDILMSPSGSSKPIVNSVQPEYDGVALCGVHLSKSFTAHISWPGPPGSVDFSLGTQHKTVNASSSSVPASLDVGADDCTVVTTRSLLITAKNPDGMASTISRTPVVVAPLPDGFGWLKDILGTTCTLAFYHQECTASMELKVPIEKNELPLVKVEADVDISVSLTYRPVDSELDLTIEAGKANETETKNPPPFRFQISDAEFDGLVTGELQWNGTSDKGYTISGGSFGGDLEGRLRFLTLGPVGPFTGILRYLPGGDNAASLVSISLYLTLDLQGTLTITYPPLTPNGEVVGSAGVEAAWEPEFGPVKIRVYAGGKGILDLNLSSPIFKSFQLPLYAGAEVDVWGWKVYGVEGNLVEWDYPKPSSTSIPSAPTAAPSQPITPISRTYRDAGPPIFFDDAHASAKSKHAAAQALAAFRNLGTGAQSNAARAATSQTTSAQSDLTLLTNVYPFSQPSLAIHGQEMMLVYVDDNGTSAASSRTDVHWTRFNGVNWSTPAPVFTDDRADFSPRVVYDGNGDAICVWERDKVPNDTATDLPSFSANLEIVWSRWDHTTGTWSVPGSLTDDSYLDYAPQLAGPMADGSVLLVWTENQANQLVASGADGTPAAGRLLSASWSASSKTWSATTVALPGLANQTSGSLAGGGSTAVYAWTRNMTSPPTTPDDQELFYISWNGATWTAPVRLTNDAVADGNVHAVVTSAGDSVLVWQHGADLMMERNFTGTPTIVRSASSATGLADFTLTAGPAGRLLLVWQQPGNQNATPYYRVYDPVSSQWSGDLQLFTDNPLARSYGVAWDQAGNLTMAYNRVEQTSETKNVAAPDGTPIQIPGVPTPGTVDLGVVKRSLVSDIALASGALSVQAASIFPGDSIAATVTVTNQGDLPVNNLVVSLNDGDPSAGGTEIARQTVTGWFAAGSSTALTFNWTMPNRNGPVSLYAVADPDNAIVEVDETNNKVSITLGGVDLAADTVSTTVESDGSARIVAGVTNIGSSTAPQSTLAVRVGSAQGTAAANATVVGLDPGRSAQVAVDLPAGTFGSTPTWVYLKADDTSLTGDINPANNQSALQLSLPSCLVSIATNAISVPSDSTSVSLDVTAPSGCPWTVASDSNWVILPSSRQAGTGTLALGLRPNDTTSARTANLTIGGQSITVTQMSAATHLAVTVPTGVRAGAGFQFSVAALDPGSNTVTAYAGTVHFTSTDPLAVLPPDGQLPAGVGTFSATLKTAGVQTITAADTTGAMATVSNSIAVTATSLCDVSQDNVTDIADIQWIVNEVLNPKTASHDLNQDHSIDVIDVQIVINAVVNSVCTAH